MLVDKRAILVATVAIVLAGASRAGETAASGFYLDIQAELGIAIFYSRLKATNAPVCATEDGFTVDLNTATGRAMLAMMLTAYSAGTKVAVWGTNTCPHSKNKESVKDLRIE
jgi:hypothetical protein